MINENDLRNMVNRSGFIDIFWRYLHDERAARPRLSMAAAYDELDDLYFDRYGVHPWPGYDAFRIYLRRHRRN